MQTSASGMLPGPQSTHVACVFSEPAVATRASVLMHGANTATPSRSQQMLCCKARSTDTLLARGRLSHLHQHADTPASTSSSVNHILIRRLACAVCRACQQALGHLR